MSNFEQFAQIAQEKWGTVRKLLRLLMTNEQLWANRSGCSWLKSDCSGCSWLKSKWANHSFFLANCSIALLFTKTSNLLKIILNKIIFFVSSKKHEQFAHSLFIKEWCEWIAQVTHDNRETMSKWLRSLTKNEQMSQSLVFSEQIAHLLIIC